MPQLEPYVTGDMLRNALLALTTTAAVNVQADVVGLLRAVLLAWLHRSAAARQMMLSLPNVSEQVRAPVRHAAFDMMWFSNPAPAGCNAWGFFGSGRHAQQRQGRTQPRSFTAEHDQQKLPAC